MPYVAPLDVMFDATRWAAIRSVSFVESSFLDRNDTTAIRASVAKLTLRLANHSMERSTASTGSSVPAPVATPDGDIELAAGISFDGARGQLGGVHGGKRLLIVDAKSLLRFSSCGFDAPSAREGFRRDVAEHAFSGQYSYCSEERNPWVDALLKEVELPHHSCIPPHPVYPHRLRSAGSVPSSPIRPPLISAALLRSHPVRSDPIRSDLIPSDPIRSVSIPSDPTRSHLHRSGPAPSQLTQPHPIPIRPTHSMCRRNLCCSHAATGEPRWITLPPLPTPPPSPLASYPSPSLNLLPVPCSTLPCLLHSVPDSLPITSTSPRSTWAPRHSSLIHPRPVSKPMLIAMALSL